MPFLSPPPSPLQTGHPHRLTAPTPRCHLRAEIGRRLQENQVRRRPCRHHDGECRGGLPSSLSPPLTAPEEAMGPDPGPTRYWSRPNPIWPRPKSDYRPAHFNPTILSFEEARLRGRYIAPPLLLRIRRLLRCAERNLPAS
jgi:hypothetical protein